MIAQRSLVRAVLAISILLSAATGEVLAADPGTLIPQLSVSPRVSDQARGFLLIYNIYTSSPANPAVQNTRLSITNTNDQRGISVHLLFVDGGNCSFSDRYFA